MARERWPKGYKGATAITPSDTVLNEWDAIYIGTSGNLAIKSPGVDTEVILAVPKEFFLEIQTEYVMSSESGTTAGDLVGFKYE